MNGWRARYGLIGAALTFTALGATAAAQHRHGDAATPPPAPPAGSRRVTMDEMHRTGGVPRGWKFTLPAGGDPARGKQVFADLECFKCHQIEGAGFPAPGGDGKVGPPLTGAGREHPAEYFAESILSPNAIVVEGPGFVGPDGRSIMPAFADSLSVTQLLDLVAFLKGQDTGPGHHDHHAISHEGAAGPYRVRVVFHAAAGATSAQGPRGGAHSHHDASNTAPAGATTKPAAGAHSAHGTQGHSSHAGHGPSSAPGAHSGHGAHGGSKAPAAGHLMVFVTDAMTGEAVPYVPVTVAVHTTGAAARSIKLAPMLGSDGFHYGADTTLPASTRRVIVSVGTPTVRVTGSERDRYGKPQSVTFEWSRPAK